MAVKIIIDSTVDIAEKYSSQFTVVPLTVSFGDTDYVDGVTINKQEFYRKLVSAPELPKTSQAAPEAFAKVFRELKKNGEEAVVITVSSCPVLICFALRGKRNGTGRACPPPDRKA